MKISILPGGSLSFVSSKCPIQECPIHLPFVVAQVGSHFEFFWFSLFLYGTWMLSSFWLVLRHRRKYCAWFYERYDVLWRFQSFVSSKCPIQKCPIHLPFVVVQVGSHFEIFWFSLFLYGTWMPSSFWLIVLRHTHVHDFMGANMSSHGDFNLTGFAFVCLIQMSDPGMSNPLAFRRSLSSFWLVLRHTPKSVYDFVGIRSSYEDFNLTGFGCVCLILFNPRLVGFLNFNNVQSTCLLS